MGDEHSIEAPGLDQERILALGMDRRQFMARAALLGLTVAAPTFIAAASPPAAAPPAPGSRRLLAGPPLAGMNGGPFARPVRAEPRALDEGARIAHLLRRAGFGASAGELERSRAMGLQATIDRLVDFDAVDDSALESRLASQDLDLEGRLSHLQRWWLQRMAYTARPLQEKMTLFWHGLLTSSFEKAGKGPAMLVQNRLLREQGMGRYDVLLKAVSRDPAMMIYLDSRSNKKSAPNENYSRELMELFTLGVGHYTEEDVRESARAFTGWQLKRKTQFVLNERQHDFGQKTFLGRTGDFDGDDIVDIIMAQPAAAEHICARLWRFYAYDDPEPEVISRLAGVFRANGTRMRPVVRAVFESEEFYRERAAAALMKSPVELVVGAVRSLGIETDFSPLSKRIERMGQALFAPPNVAGWPGGAAWINSAALLERINAANRIAAGRRGKLQFAPMALVRERGVSRIEDAAALFAGLLFGEGLREPQREAIASFLDAMGFAAAAAGRRLTFEEQVRSVVYLMLASPAYQLA